MDYSLSGLLANNAGDLEQQQSVILTHLSKRKEASSSVNVIGINKTGETVLRHPLYEKSGTAMR